MNYKLIPDDFLKNVKLVPNNFNNPENPKHGEYVHSILRKDLFDVCYWEIISNERKNLKNSKDFIKIEKIEKIKCEIGFFEKFLENKINEDD